MKNRGKMVLKKFGVFAAGGVISLVLYLIMIGIYTRVSEDPIIFFASVVIAVIVSAAVWLILAKFSGPWSVKKYFDGFTLTVMSLFYCLAVIVVAVFGPTFIDRSISYHIAFYAAEEGSIKIEDIRDEFSTEIFDKRIHDASVTGFIELQSDGSYTPTWKAKFITAVLKPLGELTESNETYEQMKRKVENR